jgi:anti-sigma regulatory factor (Ser/Thr protein kinase)
MHAAEPAAFRHEALIYRGEDEFLRGAAGFVREGLAADEAVLVVAPGARVAALREELGGQGQAVEFLDLAGLGRNPSRILPAWQEWIDRNSGRGRGFRGVCEPPLAGRGAAELLEWRRQEQLLNTAFDAGPAWSLLCPYDARRLAAEVVAWARHSHPLLCEGGARRRSATYPHPESVAGVLSGEPLAEPPSIVAELVFELGSLARVRDLVRVHAAELGLDAAGVVDLTLVASELASNSVRHGGGAGRLRLWRQGPHAVCEVRDNGLIADALVGLRRPDFRKHAGGAGLWAVNLICELVLLRSSPGLGTVVRAHLAVRTGSQDPEVPHGSPAA